MLINVLDNWLDKNGKVIVNGFVVVYVNRSSTDKVKLYSDPKFQNEALNPVPLDTAGRLQGMDGTAFFREDSVWVDVHGDENGISTRLFSFELYRNGGIGQIASGSVLSLEDALSGENPISRIIYHAHKLKYLLWNPNAANEPNGITTWRPYGLETGLYTWETTILDLWDIGIDNSGMASRVQAITNAGTIANIAKFVVKSGTYSFGDSVMETINFYDIAVEVESGVNFNFANGGSATWTVSRQPVINSMLAGITWNPTALCDFRASMLWNSSGYGEGLASEATIHNLHLDTDFFLNNVYVNETIGELNYLGEPPVLDGSGCHHTAGRLTGIMKCLCRFSEGALSQVGTESINCTNIFTIDKNWYLTQNVTIHNKSSVVVMPECKVRGMFEEIQLTVGCIIEAGEKAFGDLLKIVTTDTRKVLNGICFDESYPKTATNYIRNLSGTKTPILQNFHLLCNDDSLLDDATYMNCTFGISGSGANVMNIHGDKKITLLNCKTAQSALTRIFPRPSVPSDVSQRLKRLTMKNCDFNGAIQFGDTYGSDYCELVIEDVSVYSINFNGSFDIARSLVIDAVRIKNLTDKSTGLSYSTEGSIHGTCELKSDLNNRSALFAFREDIYDKKRPFPLNGWASSHTANGVSIIGSWRGSNPTATEFVVPAMVHMFENGYMYLHAIAMENLQQTTSAHRMFSWKSLWS